MKFPRRLFRDHHVGNRAVHCERKGKVAVFGLLETAGLPLNTAVGNLPLVWAQKLNTFTGGPKTHSKPEDVPGWWKSGAVAAEANDV